MIVAVIGLEPGLDALVSPILLYAGCVLGAVGVALALPRRGLSPQIIGALVGALGLGVILVSVGARLGIGALPNVNFYLFSAIALGAALRVISHPRPVYAALYFILTVLASCGLYVLLSAEFLAFALVIVYAGAILITYLFVLMLATESPTADQVESLRDYDRYSREPIFATIIGFLLVAGLTTMMARGAGALAQPAGYAGAQRVAGLPLKVETSLREAGLIEPDEAIALDVAGGVSTPVMDVFPERGPASVVVAYGEGGLQRRVITSEHPDWPRDLALTNIEGVAFTLLGDHPGAIEVAGVILLMAMLGAVVLARKKVELDDAARQEAETRMLGAQFTPEASPLMAPETPDAPVSGEELVEGFEGGDGRVGMTGRARQAAGGAA